MYKICRNIKEQTTYNIRLDVIEATDIQKIFSGEPPHQLGDYFQNYPDDRDKESVQNFGICLRIDAAGISRRG
jgi:hypothetical protein